jgi:chromatin segregation and condensation protein Rec8/ScpA/Scc1 (kleisin family)
MDKTKTAKKPKEQTDNKKNDNVEDNMAKKKIDKKKKTVNSCNVMETLLATNQFEQPVKKKQTVEIIKSKDIEIDIVNDTQEEIIRKLVLSVQKIKREFAEYRQYVEGTYCTMAEYNRMTNDVDNRVNELTTRVNDLPI